MFCAGAAVIVGLIWRSSGDLLTRASKVTDLHGIQDYAWLSDREALLFRVSGSGYRLNRTYSLEVIDIKSGSRRTLGNLTRLFNSSVGWSHTARLSPDRQWLLWMADRKYVASTLDGKRHYEWPMRTEFRPHPIDFEDPHMTGPCWLSDSRRWLEFEYSRSGQHFVVHDIANSRTGRVVALPPAAEWWMSESLGGDSASTKDRFVFSYGAAEVEFSGTVARTVRQLKLPPSNYPGSLVDSAFEPKTDRVVWAILQMAPKEGWVVRLLKRVFPSYKTKESARMEVWESGMDGRGKRLLGLMPVKSHYDPVRKSTGYEVSTGFRWLPSADRLSFRYDNSLWTVSAP